MIVMLSSGYLLIISLPPLLPTLISQTSREAMILGIYFYDSVGYYY